MSTDSSRAVTKTSVPDGAVMPSAAGGGGAGLSKKIWRASLFLTHQKNFWNFWYLRHCQRQQQMDHLFHTARHFHVSTERRAKRLVLPHPPSYCVNITKKILPVNNTVTLNKDLITQTVINLFKTNVVLLVEVDLPTLFLKYVKGGWLWHNPPASKLYNSN